MKSNTQIFVLSFFAFCLCGPLNAETTKNPLEPPKTGVSECRIKYGHKFFPAEIVQQVLHERGFKQELVANVEHQLNSDDVKIHDIVWEKSKTMNPNPFANLDPKDDQKLYRDVVTTIFSQALKSQGISKQKEIDSLFDEIQLRRTKKMAECDGYAQYVKPKKGFMPIVRTLTVEEDRLDNPEKYNPRLFNQIKKEGKEQPSK